MGQAKDAGHGGHGGNGGKNGRGHGGCSRSTLATVPCKHWSTGHAKTSKAISSPSALETRARTETCSGALRRGWPPTLEPSLVTMRLKSGLARRELH
jgi:hypothetical protein